MKLRKHTAIYLLLAALLTISVSWQRQKPHIFLLGDSISIHYGPYLKSFLADVARLEQKQAETLQGKEFSRNGGDSRRVLDYITHKLKEPGFHPDYLLFNCGLHDTGRDTINKELQVPLDEYRQNLEKVIAMVRAEKIKMIWVTTTPVVDSIHNTRTKQKLRYASDLEKYNNAAAEICNKHAIPMIDLNAFTSKLGTDAYIDNVHYKEYARELQAAYLSGSLNEILKEKKISPGK